MKLAIFFLESRQVVYDLRCVFVRKSKVCHSGGEEYYMRFGYDYICLCSHIAEDECKKIWRPVATHGHSTSKDRDAVSIVKIGKNNQQIHLIRKRQIN